MARTFWTQDMRKIMFARIHMVFGPHASWSGSRSPTDRGEEYRRVLTELAAYFSEMVDEEITPDAVKNQIDWGITVQKRITNKGHARNFILNKSAALEVGFITSADLPEYLDIRKFHEDEFAASDRASD